MTVAVLLYNHRHGTDVSVYTDEASATRAAADICLTYCDEARGAGGRIRELYADGKYDECVACYVDHHDHESFDVEVREVLS